MLAAPIMVRSALPEWSVMELVLLLGDVLLGVWAYASLNLHLEKLYLRRFGVYGSIFSFLTFVGTLALGAGLVWGLLMANTDEIARINSVANTSKVTQQVKDKLVLSEVKLGSTGEDVVVLQTLLYQDSSIYRGPASGYFGKITQDGVIAFQKKYNLPQTGVADIPTRDKLSEAYGDRTRKFWLSLVPTAPPQTAGQKTVNGGNDTGEWGKAIKVEGDDVTYRMRVAPDSVMATAGEIHEALNKYRAMKGVGGLNWDGKLAAYAQERANYYAANGLDAHRGFQDFLDNQDGFSKLGFRHIGENGSTGMQHTGTHLIEWVFSSDPGHESNQLYDGWTDVGIGVNGTSVDIIFGGQRY